jgi:hypothetical protein
LPLDQIYTSHRVARDKKRKLSRRAARAVARAAEIILVKYPAGV